MTEQNQQVESLREISDIRRIMERSSRFISLSGLSGIAAGLFALGGVYLADLWLDAYYTRYDTRGGFLIEDFRQLKWRLMILAVIILTLALVVAFFFTWRRARRNRLPVWDLTARKLMWNVLIPLATGGLFILAMLQYNEWKFVAPASLIFYGLALVNGSKYTLSEIRYLGFIEIVLGIVNTQYVGQGLYFWAVGFGLMHIIYGVVMWWKYERI